MIRSMLLVLSLLTFVTPAAAKVTVSSKTFTENYILAEIIAQVIEEAGETTVERRFGIGDLATVFTALKEGEIDIYPEYTGTITRTLLKNHNLDPADTDTLDRELGWLGLTVSGSLGFNNTAAMAVTQETATRLNLKKVSDLKNHTDLRVAFGHGFLERADGYPGMIKTYGLNFSNVNGIIHSLAYEAIAQGKVDLIDVYSTDAKIKRLNLTVLEDDKNFFPKYYAVLLARQDFKDKYPKSWQALTTKLENSIPAAEMIDLNALVDLDDKSFAAAASTFLQTSDSQAKRLFWESIRNRTLEHLFLVFVSLLFSIVIGLSLGIAASRVAWLGQPVLLVSGLLQTIPSLALLCFLVPLFGIGTKPALIALFLYGLLPIVRNTYTGLTTIDPKLKESAETLDLSFMERLRLIDLPLASHSIMAGIKTSAIINVGTATLAALIGAGGYGVPIVTGLSLNDMSTVLQGAIPAALLAILLHGLFELSDRLIIPKGLRIKEAA